MADSLTGKTIVVLGSIDVDMLMRVPELPCASDIVISDGLHISLGGKAANASLTFSHLGNTVYLLSSTGNDAWGQATRERLQKAGVRPEYIGIATEVPTGTVMVAINPQGEKTVIFNEDANIRITTKEIDEVLGKIDRQELAVDCFYTSTEAPLEVVIYAITEFHKRGICVFCDPAPTHHRLPKELYSLIDYLAPNQVEAEIMTGIPVHDVEGGKKALAALRADGARAIIITMSVLGALILEEGKSEPVHINGITVEQVNETGAGDAFRATFISEYLRSHDLQASLEAANKAGAQAVMDPGIPLQAKG